MQVPDEHLLDHDQVHYRLILFPGQLIPSAHADAEAEKFVPFKIVSLHPIHASSLELQRLFAGW